MLSIKHLNEKDIDLCYELDSNTISLWSKKQWANEFKKKGIKVFGLLLSNLVIGICVFHVVLDDLDTLKGRIGTARLYNFLILFDFCH